MHAHTHTPLCIVTNTKLARSNSTETTQTFVTRHTSPILLHPSTIGCFDFIVTAKASNLPNQKTRRCHNSITKAWPYLCLGGTTDKHLSECVSSILSSLFPACQEVGAGVCLCVSERLVPSLHLTVTLYCHRVAPTYQPGSYIPLLSGFPYMGLPRGP